MGLLASGWSPKVGPFCPRRTPGRVLHFAGEALRCQPSTHEPLRVSIGWPGFLLPGVLAGGPLLDATHELAGEPEQVMTLIKRIRRQRLRAAVALAVAVVAGICLPGAPAMAETGRCVDRAGRRDRGNSGGRCTAEPVRGIAPAARTEPVPAAPASRICGRAPRSSGGRLRTGRSSPREYHGLIDQPGQLVRRSAPPPQREVLSHRLARRAHRTACGHGDEAGSDARERP